MRTSYLFGAAFVIAFASTAQAQFTAQTSSSNWTVNKRPITQNATSGYGYSDCVSDNALGLTNGGEIAWLQGFDTNARGLTGDNIFRISVANGNIGGSGAAAGSTGGVYVYDDPGGDFIDPTDLTGADLTGSNGWTTCCPNTDIKECVGLSPAAPVSDGFWSAASMTQVAGEFPAALDTGTPSGSRTWVAGSNTAFDPTNPGGGIGFFEMSALGFDSVWTMTADGDGGCVTPLTQYADRASFQGANPGLNFEDYSGTLLPPNSLDCSCPPPFDTNSNDLVCWATGSIQPGVSFEPELNVAGACVFTPPALNVPSVAVGPNNFSDNGQFDFSPPVSAVGLEIFEPFGTAYNIDAQVFDGNLVLIGTITLAVAPAGTTFFGIDTCLPDKIGRIIFNDDAHGDAAPDIYMNVEFGDSTFKAPAVFCTAKTNSCGTLPAIGFSGTPSATCATGFVVTVDNAKAPTPGGNPKAGAILYSLSGGNPFPFQGGWLCAVDGLRTANNPPSSAGTPGACDASHSMDFNSYTQGLLVGQTAPDPALTLPGTDVVVQWFARDTVANGPLLSDAICFQQGL